MAFKYVYQFSQCCPYVFELINVLRVQKGTPWFIVQAIFAFNIHLYEDLDIENTKHADCSWKRSHSHEIIGRQVSLSLIVFYTFCCQKCCLNLSRETIF